MQNNDPIWFSEQKKTNANADTYQTEKIEQVDSVRTININEMNYRLSSIPIFPL